MTDYKVGDTVKIGKLVGSIQTMTQSSFYIAWDGAGGSWIQFAHLDLMGATVVPTPIEWHDGDYVRDNEGYILYFDSERDLFVYSGAKGTINRVSVEAWLRKGFVKRVKVVPYE